MSDDLTEPTPAEEPIEAPEDKPEEIDPALIALVKDLDPETLKNVKNLDEFYKRVNRMSMEVATERKKLEAQPATAPSPTAADDDDAELDDRARKIIDARVEAVLKSTVLPYIVEERETTSQKIWDEFVSAHPDVPADKIVEQFYELGFDKTATTSAKYEAAIAKAYKVAKAELPDDDDARIEQKVQERLSALKGKDEEVVEVKAKKSEIQTTPQSDLDIINDSSLPWDKVVDFFNKKA